MSARLKWGPIVAAAAAIAGSYSTPVTLRQLHYRLVAAVIGGYMNTEACYKRLSALTAEARRAGWFPPLADLTRAVKRPRSFANVEDALRYTAGIFRLDRTVGQTEQVWVLFEKATLAGQIEAWTNPYGIQTAALRGYSSESLERNIAELMLDDDRPIVVFYVGDLDPEGVDIERNAQDQLTRIGVVIDEWERLGVTVPQIAELGLVPNPGKASSSRAAGFVEEHGSLFQIEAEAIDPAVLERLVVDAVDGMFDQRTLRDLKNAEAEARDKLKRIARLR